MAGFVIVPTGRVLVPVIFLAAAEPGKGDCFAVNCRHDTPRLVKIWTASKNDGSTVIRLASARLSGLGRVSAGQGSSKAGLVVSCWQFEAWPRASEPDGTSVRAVLAWVWSRYAVDGACGRVVV